MNGNEPSVTHSWLQSLNDRIDANHREIMAALVNKVDREEIEPRLVRLEGAERRNALKLTGLAATVSAAVVWIKSQFFGHS